MEKLDNRFGVVAIKCGFITPEQLLESMEIQIYGNIEGNEREELGLDSYARNEKCLMQ